MLLTSMTGIILTLAAIPFCHSMQALAFILAIMGFNMGLVDTTANVSMLELYKMDVSPFLQVHFLPFLKHREGSWDSYGEACLFHLLVVLFKWRAKY